MTFFEGTMGTILTNVTIAMVLAIWGILGAAWLTRSPRRKKTVRLRLHSGHADHVLAHLKQLASGIASDAKQPPDPADAVKEAVANFKGREQGVTLDVVAKLIQANQEMQEKLASNEDKLREQAEQLESHAALARTDSLTLLANRRGLDDELSRRCAEFHRQGRAFSMIMTDVDHFKEFNDAHGHLAGDEVLRGVATMLRRKMREMDLVARYGGEEFAVVLPGTNLVEAERAAERAREGARTTPILHDGKSLQVTMSFGVAEISGSEDGKALLARADKALYAAKESGRNCVFVHDGTALRKTLATHLPPRPTPEFSGAAETKPTLGGAWETGSKAGIPLARVAPQATRGQVDLPDRSVFCRFVRSRTSAWKRDGDIFSVLLLETVQFLPESGDRAEQLERRAAMQSASRFLVASAGDLGVMGQYAPGCIAILLPTAGLADAIRIAEGLREGFSAWNLENGDRPTGLKLSVGAAQIMDRDDSISILMRVEEALAAAHRRGGDRTYYHDGQRCAPITSMLEAMDYLS